MAEVLRHYCEASKKLAQLKTSVQEDLGEIRASRKAANDLLVELQAASEARASLDGVAYCVCVSTKERRPPQSVSIFGKIAEDWEARTAQEWRREVEQHPDQDPLDLLLDVSLAKAWPAPKVVKSFRVKKVAATSARLEDLPEVSKNTLPLLESYLRATEMVETKTKAVQEERKLLTSRRKELEERAKQELASVPERSFRKIQLADAEGPREAFYLKLKPPHKEPPPKVAFDKLKGLVKGWVQSHVTEASSRPAFVERVSESVRTMLEDIAQELREKQKKPPKARIFMKSVTEG